MLAGVLLSLAACAGAFVLLYRLAAGRLGPDGARRTVLYLAIFPTALFLQAVYSESLYLAARAGGVPARGARPVPRSRNGRRARDADPARGDRAPAGARRARLALGRSPGSLPPALRLARRRGRVSGAPGGLDRRAVRVPPGPGRDLAAGALARRAARRALGRRCRPLQPTARPATTPSTSSSSDSRSPSSASPSWPGGASARPTGSSPSSAWRSRSRSRRSAGRCSRCRGSGSSSSRSLLVLAVARRAAAPPFRDRRRSRPRCSASPWCNGPCGNGWHERGAAGERRTNVAGRRPTSGAGSSPGSSSSPRSRRSATSAARPAASPTRTCSTATRRRSASIVIYGILLAIVRLRDRTRALPRRVLRAPAAPLVADGRSGYALGGYVAIFVGAGLLLLGLDAGDEQGLTPEGWDSSRAGAYAANFLAVAFVGPVVEELLYRGAGLSLLLRFGPVVAVLVDGGLLRARPRPRARAAGARRLRARDRGRAAPDGQHLSRDARPLRLQRHEPDRGGRRLSGGYCPARAGCARRPGRPRLRGGRGRGASRRRRDGAPRRRASGRSRSP